MRRRLAVPQLVGWALNGSHSSQDEEGPQEVGGGFSSGSSVVIQILILVGVAVLVGWNWDRIVGAFKR